MSTVISGIVSNGVIIPNTLLPEGTHVEIHMQPVARAYAGRCTASELRKLPREARQAALTAAAEWAEHDYRHDKELTGFDAFGEELDDDSP